MTKKAERLPLIVHQGPMFQRNKIEALRMIGRKYLSERAKLKKEAKA